MQVDKLEVEFNLISNIQRIYFSLVAFFSNCHFSSFDYRVRSSESLECLVVFDCIYHFSTLDYKVGSRESLASLVVLGRVYRIQHWIIW